MGLFDPASDEFIVDPRYTTLVRAAGLDARGVFENADIRVWRQLADRQNCTFDTVDREDKPVRLHVKRYVPVKGATPAEVERAGYDLLVDAKIPTAPLVASGKLVDGRSFMVWLDLKDHVAGDKFVTSAETFADCLEPTADLAARLHQAELHHRDMYLCHFMIDPRTLDVRLIDTARVARLPGWLTRRRWIVKDLAQFWYSTTKHPITDEQRDQWLDRYCQMRQLPPRTFRAAIVRKSAAIGRHDRSLNLREPTRNVSLPAPGLKEPRP